MKIASLLLAAIAAAATGLAAIPAYAQADAPSQVACSALSEHTHLTCEEILPGWPVAPLPGRGKR